MDTNIILIQYNNTLQYLFMQCKKAGVSVSGTGMPNQQIMHICTLSPSNALLIRRYPHLTHYTDLFHPLPL